MIAEYLCKEIIEYTPDGSPEMLKVAKEIMQVKTFLTEKFEPFFTDKVYGYLQRSVDYFMKYYGDISTGTDAIKKSFMHALDVSEKQWNEACGEMSQSISGEKVSTSQIINLIYRFVPE